jgi:hypothetical protein
VSDHDAIAAAVILAGLLYCGLRYAPNLLGPNGKLALMTQRISKTDEIKTYGGNPLQDQQLANPFVFRLAGLRYDEVETHEFAVTRKADTVLALRFMGIDDDQVGELAPLVVRLIAKSLDNTDGVPVQWSPIALDKPKNAGEDWEPKFRGPDGKLHPMSQAGKFEEFAAGSSRRRWELLLLDSQFTVELETLVEITKDLIERTTGTPTAG